MTMPFINFDKETIAIYISIVSLIFSFWVFRRSDQRVKKANKIAKKALKMAKFEFIEKIEPSIKVEFYMPKGSEGLENLLVITNESRGSAIIEKIKPFFSTTKILLSGKKELSSPITVGYKNNLVVNVEFLEIDKGYKDAAITFKGGEEEIRRRLYLYKMKDLTFEIIYKDIADNEYIASIFYDINLEKFITLSEGILESDQRHSKYQFKP